MSAIAAKCLVNAQFAPALNTTLYTAPASASTNTIIDKFTATNTDSGPLTLSVNLVRSGGSAGSSNLIIDAVSIAAAAIHDFSELQNQILNAGDSISVLASSADKIVVRVSGREVT